MSACGNFKIIYSRLLLDNLSDCRDEATDGMPLLQQAQIDRIHQVMLLQAPRKWDELRISQAITVDGQQQVKFYPARGVIKAQGQRNGLQLRS